MNALDIYEKITATSTNIHGNIKRAIEGKRTYLLEDVSNHYYKDQLPVIPAGSELLLHFAGDFGCYALADVNGTLHRVNIEMSDLMKIDWSFLNEMSE